MSTAIANALLPQQQHWEEEQRREAREAKPNGLIDWPGQEPLPRKVPQRQGREVIEIGEVRALFEQASAAVRLEITELKRSYVFSDASVEWFLETHRALPGILQRAIGPLKDFFGAERVFRLELLTDDDDSKMLYVVVIWSASVRSAAKAFDNFVENWWLDHMTSKTADLAFIYRISR